MKKIVIVAVAAIALLAMAFTNPSGEEHQRAVIEEISGAFENYAGNSNVLVKLIGGLGLTVGNREVESYVNKNLTVNNYVLFSLGTMQIDDKTYYLSVGAFGHAFTTFDKDNLYKVLIVAAGNAVYNRIK
ncbi:MAG: DUF4359 domain-containing protein [Muribaculaceae bacterium]